MKVLMLANGTSVHSTRPLDGLLNAGWSVIFADAHDPLPGGRPGYRFVALPPDDPNAQLTLLRTLRATERPDITHVHWMDSRVLRCMQADLHPLVLSLWGSDINQNFLPQTTQAMRDVAGRILSGCDLVVIDSHDMPDKCRTLAGRDVPSAFLHLGVDTGGLKPGFPDAKLKWSAVLDIPPDAKVLLSPRAWGPHYNHHFILEAFAAARMSFTKPAFLVFKVFNATYPESRTYLEQVKRFSAALNVSSHVRWIDAVPWESLPEFYAFADVIVNYPTQDTLGVTLLEAAACQRPVISCRLPSYEGTFAERCFLMTQLGNMNELANAMATIVNADAEQGKERLIMARKEVETRFDSRLYIDGLITAYQQLIAARSEKEPALV